MSLTGTVGALQGQEELSLRSDELSRLGRGPSGGERAVPGTLISIGVRERDVWLAPHCGGGTGVTVPGLGAVGSGGRGVPGSVEKRKRNQPG